VKNQKHMVMGEDFLVGDPMEKPPVCPKGFERAEDNEYVLLKMLPVCSARDTREQDKACCGIVKAIYCEQMKAIITRKDCLDCESPILVMGGKDVIRTRISESV